MLTRLRKYFEDNWRILMLSIFVGWTRLQYMTLRKTSDFWHDESFQYLFSQNNVSYIMQSHDVHPFGYNLLAHYIIPFTKNNPQLLRLFGAMVFSYFAIVLLYLLLEAMFNKDVALYSTILLAVSPTYGWYSAEFRSYSFVLFILVLQILFFNVWLNEEKGWQLFAWLLLSLAAVYSHILAILIIIIQIPFAIYIQKKSKKYVGNLLATIAVFLLGCIPLLIHAMNVMRQSESFWFKNINWVSFISTFAYYITPPLDRITGITIFFYALIIWYLWHNRHNISSDIWQFILYATVPVIIMWSISQWIPFYHPRYFLFGGIGVYVLAGLAIKHLENIRSEHGEFVLAGIALIMFMSMNFIPLNHEIQDSTKFFANMTNYSTVASSQFSQTPYRFYLPNATHYLLTNFTDKQLFTAGGAVIQNKVHSIDEISFNTSLYYIGDNRYDVAMWSEGGLNVCRVR